MKGSLLLLLVAGAAFAHADNPKRAIKPSAAVATCVGANPCKACKNCKYCKRCAKDAKNCGVCKK